MIDGETAEESDGFRLVADGFGVFLRFWSVKLFGGVRVCAREGLVFDLWC